MYSISITMQTTTDTEKLNLKARSHCTDKSKEDAKRKKILPSVEKRYAFVVYSLRTYFIRSTPQASVHCDFIRFKSFELHKFS